MPPPRRLSDYPWVIVNVACALCPRRGRYRLARLAERHGADALLDDVLRAIAGGCTWWNERPRKYDVRCGARFEDLMLNPPPDDPPEPPCPHGPPPTVTGVVLRRHGPPREALPGPPRGHSGPR